MCLPALAEGKAVMARRNGGRWGGAGRWLVASIDRQEERKHKGRGKAAKVLPPERQTPVSFRFVTSTNHSWGTVVKRPCDPGETDKQRLH